MAQFLSDPKNLISAVAILVSLSTFGISFWFNWRSSVISRRPILVFICEVSGGWTVRNVGNGPALNIVVAEKNSQNWFHPVRLPPIGKDKDFEIGWIDENAAALGATYSDYDGRPYTSTCEDDLSLAFPGETIGGWSKKVIERHWAQDGRQK